MLLTAILRLLQGDECGEDNEKHKYSFEHICFQSHQSEGGNRDVHGKLLTNKKSGFITKTYENTWQSAEACINAKLKNVHKKCADDTNQQLNSDYFQCRVEKRKEAIKDCDWFEPIQTSLELIFGTQTSPGFICGVADSVVNDRTPMPGS